MKIIKICNVFLLVQWVKRSSGKDLAVIAGHTYFLRMVGPKQDRWVCSKCSSNHCRAFFIATKNKEIIRHKTAHNHEPSKYVIFNGLYMKLWIIYICTRAVHCTYFVIPSVVLNLPLTCRLIEFFSITYIMNHALYNNNIHYVCLLCFLWCL